MNFVIIRFLLFLKCICLTSSLTSLARHLSHYKLSAASYANDHTALLTFVNAVGNWGSFDVNGNHCQWSSVQCTDSIVTALDLNSKGVAGHRLSAFKLCRRCTSDCSWYMLWIAGTIPSELGLLVGLNSLQLNYNSLFGIH